MQKFPMTAPGLAALEEELRMLKGQERPAIIRAIAEARAHGDLSENAEYHAARERQSFVEGRIAELEESVARLTKKAASQTPSANGEKAAKPSRAKRQSRGVDHNHAAPADAVDQKPAPVDEAGEAVLEE